MTTYYVLHSGIGTDGGFGDYAPPYWSDKPVSIDGKTVWFGTESEARLVVDWLNESARCVHNYVSYSGDFPAEYEYRRIDTPDCPAASADEAAWLIAERHQEWWPRGYGCDDPECDEDCEEDCPYCGDFTDDYMDN